MDTFSKTQRSKIMAKVRSRGNRSTEQRLRIALMRARLRSWKLNAKSLPGSPDIAFPQSKTAIFIDGCFWHGCLKCYRRPQTSQSYWDAKVQRNKTRDKRNRKILKQMGWQTIRIWEHQLKADLKKCVEKIAASTCAGANKGRTLRIHRKTNLSP